MTVNRKADFAIEIPYQELNKELFLALAMETFRVLDWNIGQSTASEMKAYTKTSLASWGEEVTVRLQENSAWISSNCIGNQWMDWGKNKKNVTKFVATFESLMESKNQEEMEQILQVYLANQDSREEPIIANSPLEVKEQQRGFLSFFIPSPGYTVTPILANLNMLIFLIMVLSGVGIFLPDTESLLNWGANFRPVTLEGQWWRMLTACFLHIGILHLAMNMYALIYIGFLLEPMLGKSRFLTAYLLSGIAASAASLWWNDLSVSAGASGAIFGMYGVFIALLSTDLMDRSVKKAFMTSIGVFVLFNLLNGLKSDSGIDNAAHIGGLLSGLLIGFAFVPGLKKPHDQKLHNLTINSLTALVLGGAFAVYSLLPNDIGKYDLEMQRFVENETKALEIYKIPENTPTNVLLLKIKGEGLYYWHENIKLLDRFNSYDLPEDVRSHNMKLREYCELRIRSYELIYRSIEEDTDKYQPEINEVNRLIEQSIRGIKEE